MLLRTLASSLVLLAAGKSVDALTVYTSETGTAAFAQYTVASTDQTFLTPPPAPADQAASIPVQLYEGGMAGMGIAIGGGFLGYSIELSVANTLLGENAQYLRPEFLNYCALLEARGGSVTIRVGGNSQDKATLNAEGNPSGKTIDKYKGQHAGPTETPEIHFTLDIFRAMAEITKLVKVNWFFGIPFLNTNADGNAGLVVQNARAILGDSLLGLQLANEPDLYGKHLKKFAEYGIADFFTETTQMIQSLPITDQIIIGPSVCCEWTIDQLLNAGYMDQFNANLKYIDSMRYPDNNCAVDKPDPQEKFANYLSHTVIQEFLQPYFLASNRAVAAGKQYMMMETNTASCGGFPGISDSFAASLWGVDWAMQQAHGNFSYVLLHFGGQNVFYNPFTPPPTNMTKVRQWSTGAIFYSILVVAEALGKTGQSHVLDLGIDGNNPNRAGYAIYDGNVASRFLLINYVSNPGASDYTAVLSIGGGETGMPSTTPASVKVKYLLSATGVSEKYNITWAGQTMRGQQQSDGRLYGEAQVVTIACDVAAGTCSIPVPAPSIALVFLTDAALANSGGAAGEIDGKTLTFATTMTTSKKDRVQFDMASIATSNGRSGKDPMGATSWHASLEGKSSWGSRSAGIASSVVLAAFGAAAFWMLRAQ